MRNHHLFIVGLGFLFVAAFAFRASADGKEDVAAAAKKLVDAKNYTWKTTTEGGFGAGTTDGKTADGLTTLSIVRGDNTIEVVIKGEKAAIKTGDGWKSAAELAQQDQGPQRFIARIAQNFKAPAEQAQEVAGKATKLEKSDDALAGDLSEDGAKSLMTFGRPGAANAPTISNAKGTAKFWVKDGALAKAQYHVTGSVSFNGQDRDIDRTTTIEFKDVGSTKVEAPAEAKEKL
jgi:hypothetical protein